MRILSSLIVTTSLMTSQDASARPKFETAAPIAYLVDLSSGAILFDKQAQRRIPPASMAKMMTAYVAFDLISRDQLKPEQTFSVRPETWKKWNNTGSSMFLKPNEQVSVANLLHGVVTLSGNDAAIVLAEGISGSEAEFVRLMNAQARRLGMKDSQFGTANGWPDNGRTLTTAKDLALLATRTIQDFPALYRQYYGKKIFSWNDVKQPNRNPILGRIEGADGMKTGYTNQAGYCLTGTAEQNGRRLMMVVAGLGNMEARTVEARRLLNWGLTAWRAEPLFEARLVIASLPVQLGVSDEIDVATPRKLALSLPTKNAQRYQLSVRYRGPIKAPVDKGVQIAELVVRFENGETQTMPLLASHSVSKAGFLGRAWNGLRLLVRA